MDTEKLNKDVARPEQEDRELKPPRRLRAWLDIWRRGLSRKFTGYLT